MFRKAVIVSGALASVMNELNGEDVASTIAAMEARMEARLDAKKAIMQAKIDDLETRLKSVGKGPRGRKLYNSAFLAEEPGDDDLTGLLSFIPEITTAMGTTWTILCGALVFFMNAGFALLESGVCRAVSCQSVFLKNMLDACFGTILWFTCGFTLMYGSMAEGDDGTPLQVIGGIDTGAGFFGDGLIDSTADPVVQMGFIGPNHLITCQDWFFQWAFCVTAATIVSGGVAERLQMGGYLIFTTFMTAFIYPTVGAMTWGCGFLYDMGYSDFAGSGIVHLTGGIGALVGAIVVGPRVGRFEGEGADPNGTYAPHNVPNAALGTFILWFGWYGFNCGSTLYMEGFASAGSAALVAVNTTLAPAAGGIAAMALRRFVLEPKAWNVTYVCGGILAGLVSITAGCGNIHPRGAILVGFIGGIIYCGASEALQKAKIDDPVEAFPVHGACGIWGVMAVPLFDINTLGAGGDLYGPGIPIGESIVAQAAGCVVIPVWVGLFSGIMFVAIKAAGLLRVEEEHEKMGIDNAEFSPKAAYKGGSNI
jgi:Amt family ammonium transporter